MSSASALNEWRCASCGESHDELPAAVFAAPGIWFDASEKEQAEDFELTSDTCIWKGEHFFVRGVLAIELLDRDGTFEFGVWNTLSRENFLRYLEVYESADRASLGPMFGWLSNSLPGYPDTTNLKCHMNPREPGMRPLIELDPSSHPLSIQQQVGMHFENSVAYCHEHLAI